LSRFSVCFVCTGNICRSPTAEGVFRAKVAGLGLPVEVMADSAGTHGYHVGQAPDPRAVAAAAARGYDLSGLRARKFDRMDFHRFDLVIAMDSGHRTALARLAQPTQAHKLKMITAYSIRFADMDVPDPYYGAGRGFERVLDMLEESADGLLGAIADTLQGGAAR
jgi:protein-tyrosine phosphatase